jgi:hypothetical protein
VPVGRWIKRAGIDRDDLFQASSLFLTENRQAWVKEDSMRQGQGWQLFCFRGEISVVLSEGAKSCNQAKSGLYDSLCRGPMALVAIG